MAPGQHVSAIHTCYFFKNCSKPGALRRGYAPFSDHTEGSEDF